MGHQLPSQFHNKFYNAKQIFVALTLVSMVFLLGKFTSVTVFGKFDQILSQSFELQFFLCLDTRPERIRLSRWYNKDNHLSNSKKSRDHDDNGPKILQLSTSKQYNYIIENQRLRISREMTSFPFDKDHDVNDYIPDEGGQPVRAMVIPK